MAHIVMALQSSASGNYIVMAHILMALQSFASRIFFLGHSSLAAAICIRSQDRIQVDGMFDRGLNGRLDERLDGRLDGRLDERLG